MTCINTGNAWVRARNSKGARRNGSWRDFGTHLVVGGRPWRRTFFPGSGALFQDFFVLLELLHACIDNLILISCIPRETSVGLVDGVNEAWVTNRPTSHRCWPSRSAFQGWLCLENTSQYRCWRWKPTELSEEEMFTAFVHCGALELDPEHEDQCSWPWRACAEATVKCFLKATFSRIYSTYESWYTFQVVVDDDELEMWLAWL